MAYYMRYYYSLNKRGDKIIIYKGETIDLIHLSRLKLILKEDQSEFCKLHMTKKYFEELSIVQHLCNIFYKQKM